MFIKLTTTNQLPLYVNTNLISHFYRCDGSYSTWLVLANGKDNDDEKVIETPEQIMELINERK
ncbi:hypothetical protein vBAspATola_20 [Aeromonas phage vB_AspA_Tola]|nr:hypothetical protein vBAspATola_20 [Aeromonas phage vB_AspA_Tola]